MLRQLHRKQLLLFQGQIAHFLTNRDLVSSNLIAVSASSPSGDETVMNLNKFLN